jgi:hypothetical protein
MKAKGETKMESPQLWLGKTDFSFLDFKWFDLAYNIIYEE